ncbi:hypothetical protein CRENPOLYSF1_200081 [Crenothrix polyspora]|uniref:Uncharacterized protein n=1 Tax=Crenothrix polyspora TaxID=360316 RepID=A0A1R4H7D9_9GAMM|nr:hypothetical protein CRENPOLYSF1_200081 [Crenothrix polyspora]
MPWRINTRSKRQHEKYDYTMFYSLHFISPLIFNIPWKCEKHHTVP